MKEDIKRTITALITLTLILGIAYPLTIWVFGHSLFPNHANGYLIRNREKQVIGSAFIGQNFSKSIYFHPRPSHAGIDGYDAMASNGSNLSPSSKKLQEIFQHRIEIYREENHLPIDQPIPVDAIAASASGLDPHISVENAKLQAPRVADARHIPLEVVEKMISKETKTRWLGLFGEPRVNVLLLNQKLDQ